MINLYHWFITAAPSGIETFGVIHFITLVTVDLRSIWLIAITAGRTSGTQPIIFLRRIEQA